MAGAACLLFLFFTLAQSITEKEFTIYNELEEALTNNSLALFSLRKLFFPSTGAPGRLCTPIRYQLSCGEDINVTYNYLWTQYNSNNLVGQILVNFAHYGIVLRGFNWEQYCHLYHINGSVTINLDVPSLDCINDEEIVHKQLLDLTTSLRTYASLAKTSSGISGESFNSYGGHSVNWTDDPNDDIVFHSSYVILTTIISLIDFFVFFFSLGIASNVYDTIYDHIKCKKSPYYPLFWSFVSLVIIWDVGPGWLVLSAGSIHVRSIIGVMVPLQLFIAIFMKKYVDFPIPGLNWKKLSAEYQGYCHQPGLEAEQGGGHSGRGKGKSKYRKSFFWQVARRRFRLRVALSFIVQTLAVWGLLIFFTYIVLYSMTITISLYLFPIHTLLKLIFIKAVALCAVFDVALIFIAGTWQSSFNKKSILHNFGLIVQLLAVISFFPILVFLSFVVGGILFTDSADKLNGIQGILALLPSAFLILVGWYTHGKLFPEELVSTNSIADIEKNAESKDEGNPSAAKPSISSTRPSMSLAEKAKAYMDSNSVSYGAADETTRFEGGGGGERDPLLPSSRPV
ncbi:PREDICTED: uncharacterized protein LOC109581846 [Amphimedon queenslandica]|uniref:Uncharacterized protein n=1 Tax=Amphimedon queenslandica TaxID=400682 RepID=A0A1X7UVS7_AMPQE|nr:PREDICTED: uncharacterized protein LOC109581846 [Amphimedon queenslandica]|eukprot:XP_019851856.1 PREDICTED: uncharacterized protein LOC109581846 [Amphimedon queenslandica]